VKDINVTLGGCAFWHAIISIRKQPGEGKNALLAALSVMDLKHVVVVDDDIDVFNPTDVEWAIATRVQADRDVFIIPGARAKPLDPSLAVTPPGVVPTGAKVGIDATIGEGIPHERFERIAYAYADRARIADYLAGKGDTAPAHGDPTPERISESSDRILELIEAEPVYYQDVAARFTEYDFQTVARALGKLHAEQKLWQDARGRLCVRGSRFAAKPPAAD
jgi:2,5-furandicarboxylate decarboxylase 1